MTESKSDKGAVDPGEGGRRKGDRRQDQQPFEGPDRRKGARRSGEDRRTTPRDNPAG